MKSYSELITLPTFEERFEYLASHSNIGDTTFGGNRIFNQQFYSSEEWKRARREVILRDNGCDLGIPDREINGKIMVHHINPLTVEDIMNHTFALINPENLITMSYDTHNALHFGNLEMLKENDLVVRTKNDTCPWRKS